MFKLKPSGIYEQNLAQSYYELFKIYKKYRQKKKKSKQINIQKKKNFYVKLLRKAEREFYNNVNVK